MIFRQIAFLILSIIVLVVLPVILQLAILDRVIDAFVFYGFYHGIREAVISVA